MDPDEIKKLQEIEEDLDKMYDKQSRKLYDYMLIEGEKAFEKGNPLNKFLGTDLFERLISHFLWKEDAFARNLISESIASLIVFFGSAYWFNEDDPKHAELRKFEQDLHTPALSESTRIEPSSLKAYALIGKICLIVGLVLIACVFTPSSPIAPAWLNVVAGVMCTALGAVILNLTRGQDKSREESTS